MSAPPRLDHRAIVLALACAAGCATSPAPEGMRRTMEQAQKSPYGAWCSAILSSADVVSGELLAVDTGDLLIGIPPVRVPAPCVRSLRVAAFETSPTSVALVGAAGTASTLSHGGLLIFSAPVWLITTGIAVYVHTGSGYESYTPPARPLVEARRWARFPQGAPAAFAADVPPALDARCLPVVARPPPAGEPRDPKE
jgi:hypothetical protein